MLASFAKGQGMYKLGFGNEVGQVQTVAQRNGDLYLIEVDAAANYQMKKWDGLNYTDFGVLPLPKHGYGINGEFKICNSVWHNNSLFVLGKYATGHKSSTPNIVIEWDGTSWKNISDSNVTSAYDVYELITYQNKLTLVGKYKKSNVLVYDGIGWVTSGGVLTSDKLNDFVLDVESYKGKLYACGDFTQQTNSFKYHISVFDGDNWVPIKNPPFLNESYKFGLVDDKLLLCGNQNLLGDFVKVFDGNTWDNISGLDLKDIEVIEFWDVVEYNDAIYITGLFAEKGDFEKRFNLLTYRANKWFYQIGNAVSLPLKLAVGSKGIYAYGSFESGLAHNIGQIMEGYSIIGGRVFIDKNANCTYDEGIDYYYGGAVITLNPGNYKFITNADGSYEIPVKNGVYDLAYTPDNKHLDGCISIEKISVAKTGNVKASADFRAVEKPDVVDLDLNANLKNGWKLVRGKQNEIKLSAVNNGTVSINAANLNLKMGDWWSSVEFMPKPDLQNGNEYVWKVEDLGVGNTFEIIISGIIRPDIELYNDFCFTGDVHGTQTDIDGQSRQTEQFESVDSLEPFLKQSNLGNWFTLSEKYVEYQIRLRNDGENTINSLRMIDTLDADLPIDYNKLFYIDYNLGQTFTEKITYAPTADGKYRMIREWETSDANILPENKGNDENVGYVFMKIPLITSELKTGMEFCNQAWLFINNKEPNKSNVVCSNAASVGVPRTPKKSTIEIYPNPSFGLVYIKNVQSENLEVEIFGITGQKMRDFQLANGKTLELSTSSWAKGVYFVKVNGFDSYKLIVQ
ncbi:MAG: T9SS type A sorting domain-containing protein [Bacteroidia bacterium]